MKHPSDNDCIADSNIYGDVKVSDDQVTDIYTESFHDQSREERRNKCMKYRLSPRFWVVSMLKLNWLEQPKLQLPVPVLGMCPRLARIGKVAHRHHCHHHL